MAKMGSILRRALRATVLAGSVLAVSAAGSLAADLNIYNWGEYINPAVLKRFEDETGIKVNLSTYASNEEMLAKIQGGATGYDIVFPSVHMQEIMSKLDLLEKTDINQYEGFGNIDPAFLRAKSDPNGEYCLPYAWGSVGIMYNRKVLGKDITGWHDLIETVKAKGLKFALLDDVREVMGVGLMLNGHSVNSTDPAELQQAADTIIAMKPYVAAFTYESRPMVGSGDVAAAHYFIGSMIDVFGNPKDLGYVIPEEGATMYQENICVLKTAPNKENALKFMQFYTQPEIPALNMAQQTNGTANMKARALTPDNIKNSEEINPPPETMKRLQIFEDIGKDIRQYDRLWTRIKTAQ
ncbi:spermidine/putrescine ABC transporter substrate-binding protein [Aquamicrobium lusatiense]|jgi:spermidine/putrescine transport system substrate-binding protein|uniref:polyamine ABC transporter substrate-binding protein n=1 Tax=Aquamicrobium lusatiense TaxID=89772 RepID=UPI002455C562|nr:spermidine/putrescine ABC transporter substrate-binding protein [Aquamicrobium lusatiense]MDH4989972.1 spermidine/putrescine ABC transporter substrate-binding protein [Aquamicrobium lusatiense]